MGGRWAVGVVYALACGKIRAISRIVASRVAVLVGGHTGCIPWSVYRGLLHVASSLSWNVHIVNWEI